MKLKGAEVAPARQPSREMHPLGVDPAGDFVESFTSGRPEVSTAFRAGQRESAVLVWADFA